MSYLHCWMLVCVCVVGSCFLSSAPICTAGPDVQDHGGAVPGPQERLHTARLLEVGSWREEVAVECILEAKVDRLGRHALLHLAD
eukprot:581510-Rhodomonas_salina.4